MLQLKISVLTPSFNAASTIRATIESVLSQHYICFEHIIIDGGSNDGTQAVVSEYPHVLLVSESDRGQSDAMNKAVAASTGDLIVFLNADDILFPGAFAAVSDLARSRPDCDLYVGRFELFSEGATRIVKPVMSFDSLVLWEDDWPYNPVSYFFTKRLHASIGDFPISNHLTMDYWWLLRALRRANVAYCEAIMGRFNNLAGNKTSDTFSSLKSSYAVRRNFLISDGLVYLPRFSSIHAIRIVRESSETLSRCIQIVVWKVARLTRRLAAKTISRWTGGREG